MHKQIYLDPDFRRSPKTETFCCVCQKDIKDQANRVWYDFETMSAVHPEDVEPAAVEAKDVKLLWIGDDCAKKVPADYVVTE